MKPVSYIGIAAAVIIGFLAGHRCSRNGPGTIIEHQVDTLLVRDTIKVTEPVSVTKWVVDSVLVPVHDTTRVRDTLYLLLEREQVIWDDSLSVVYASGINPQVDSVVHRTLQMIVTEKIPVVQVKKTRWGVGVQAGVSANKDGILPYVGVGVSYNILSW